MKPITDFVGAMLKEGATRRTAEGGTETPTQYVHAIIACAAQIAHSHLDGGLHTLRKMMALHFMISCGWDKELAQKEIDDVIEKKNNSEAYKHSIN